MTYSYGCPHRHPLARQAIECGDADLRGANLRHADLSDATLAEANLAGADLAGANLWHANLADADLAGANLAGVNLWGANLAGAKGLVPQQLPLARPGKIAAFKLVTTDGHGIYRDDSPIYEVGRTYTADLDRDPANDCAAGIHVASLSWCMAEWRPGHRLLACEMDAADAVIPLGRPGKFRTAKLTVTGEMRI